MNFCFVKDKVIPYIPHSPNNRTISKQILYILWWSQTKSHENYTPNNFLQEDSQRKDVVLNPCNHKNNTIHSLSNSA
jgi:hypothetical protein